MNHRRNFRALDAVLLVCLGIGSSIAYADEPLVNDSAAAADAPQEQVGWLRKNASHPDVNAPYSLVDTGGVIRCYVRPAKGIEMDRYLNRKMRVRGTDVGAGDSSRVLEVDQVGPPEGPLPPPPRFSERPRKRGVERAAYFDSRPAANYEEIPTPAQRSPSDVPPGGAENIEPYSADGAGPNGGPYHMGHGHDGFDGGFEDGSGGGPGCAVCGGCGHDTCNSCCHGFCGPPGRIWVRIEYLYWFTEGMRVPPLVTTGPSVSQPGFLGSPGTTILNGGDRVDGNGRSGGRLTVGGWLNCAQTVGLEGDFFMLSTGTSNYSASSLGDPILSRPFFDTRPTLVNQNVEQVASPGAISGTVSTDSYTRLSSAGLWLRFNLCCSTNCYNYCCLPCLSGPGANRFDFVVGYRYLNLSDGVAVTENLNTAAQPANGLPAGAFVVNDTFTTRNQFNGAEFGTIFSAYRGGRWSLELLQKIALGNVYEVGTVNGFTTSSPAGGTATTLPGGLLAQSSNIGRYARNEFGVIPQFGANLGYQLTPRLRATVGYTFLYVSRVMRAGDQIDLNVNSTLLPNSPTPPAGDIRHPMFAWQDTDFWAQGISAGLDYRF